MKIMTKELIILATALMATAALPALPSQPGASGPAWQAEEDAFQRCAKKALSGEYGELTDWQEAAYQWGLARNITVDGYAKITSYGFRWENEPGQNQWTASGSHVHTAGCAANPGLPFGTLIWTPRGLRYVFDRGGAVTLAYTNGRESANFDYYTKEPVPTRRNAPYAVVKQNGDRSVRHRKEGELP